MRNCSHEECEKAHNNRDEVFKELFSQLHCEFGQCGQKVVAVLMKGGNAYYLCVTHNLITSMIISGAKATIIPLQKPFGEHEKGS